MQNYTCGYDLYGNRVSQTALQTGYNFNPTINPVNNHITTSGYTYDAAGNMTVLRQVEVVAEQSQKVLTG